MHFSKKGKFFEDSNGNKNLIFHNDNERKIDTTGCLYKLSRINLVWGPLKCSKSNFNPVHVFLHFKSFCLVVLILILASKLSDLQQFKNRAANYQLASIKGGNEAKKQTNAINKV